MKLPPIPATVTVGMCYPLVVDAVSLRGYDASTLVNVFFFVVVEAAAGSDAADEGPESFVAAVARPLSCFCHIWLLCLAVVVSLPSVVGAVW